MMMGVKINMPRENTIRTRKSLLEAAVNIFAKKGFLNTTIAEISGQAGTNIAAVNYHFGSKETLYVEAWRSAFKESMEAHPPDGGVSDKAPVEDRFRGHVKAIIGRLTDKGNKEFLFVQREFANPTGLLEKVVREEITPIRNIAQNLVRELLGPHASDADVFFCETNIISMCVNPSVSGNILPGNEHEQMGPPRIKDINAYTDHVVKFSMAGLKAIRKSAEQRYKNG
jgi:TetR/AcrR family transcriptional regulator, regulator of cefoperazone and chloramphenicol sensitivity